MKNVLINISIVLGLVLLGILGYINYKNNFLINQQNNKIKAQIEANEKLVAKYDSLTRAREDSVVTIDNYIYIKEKKKEDVKTQIQNTVGIDSIIANYKKFRPGESGMKAIDSNSVNITKEEVKFVTEKFIDLNFLNDIKVPGLEKQIGIFKRIVADKESVIFLKDSTINLLMEEVKNLTPTFWDKVLKWLIVIGAGVSGYLLGM